MRGRRGPGDRAADEETGADGWWNRDSRLDVFLQRRTEPSMVYRIAIEEGSEFNDGTVRVERATATDTVVFCIPEKGGGGENLKFVYDIRAKALVKRIAYERFPMCANDDRDCRQRG